MYAAHKPFYSINEPRKSVRVFHSNDMCQPGRESLLGIGCRAPMAIAR